MTARSTSRRRFLSHTVSAAIAAHRAARAVLNDTCDAADDAAVEQAGGDTSDVAMAPARGAHEAAEAAEEAAWNDLLSARPAGVAELVELVRYIAGSPALDDVQDHRALLAGVAEVAGSLVPNPHLDAAILALEPEFHQRMVVLVEAQEAADRIDAAIEGR